MSILFVSENKNKVNEINRVLKNLSKTLIVEHHKLDLPEIQGEPIQISLEKCKTAKVLFHKDFRYNGIFTEDVSLCFNALNSMPGPYIKHFLKNLDHSNLYKLLNGFEDKSAYALCTYTYYNTLIEKYISCYGKVNGTIVKPMGSNDFGWDSIFQPDCFDITFEEMTLEQKDSCSHRAKSLEKLVKLF